MTSYRHLGEFSDWVATVREQRELPPLASPGPQTQTLAADVLAFGPPEALPRDVVVGQRWERDGVVGEAVSWSVGYGPRTQAWVLKPAGATEPLPGVVALHDHAAFKFFGKEKIADGPDEAHRVLGPVRDKYYEGRAWANDLARQGFVVLVHDTFLWGSRRFALETMPEPIRNLTAASRSLWAYTDDQELLSIAEYNAAALHHEHVVEKYCAVLGTTMAAVVAYEDRIALNHLASRDDVLADRIGCIGLSGGGNRATLLVASSDRLAAAVVVGLMSTYEGLLDHSVQTHTWMLFPHGWARHGDWPDLTASRAPMPLLVQYDLEDGLFTEAGMRAADARLASHYEQVGAAGAYRGAFYPGPHKFDVAMQQDAFAWLAEHLGG